MAPNDYVITLSEADYQKVSADPDRTSTTFARHLEGFIHDQGWQTYGDVVVRFEPSPSLHTGQFRARGAVATAAAFLAGACAGAASWPSSGARSWAELPAQCIKYVRRLEELIEAPVALLSTSPKREDNILVHDPFVD